MSAVLSDAQVVARCREGDESAWAELVTRLSRYVYAICTQAYRLSPADADDVFQEVFTRTYRSLDRLRDDDAIRPWIGQMTRRLCVDRFRAAAREGPAFDELPERAAPDGALDQIEQAVVIREALAELPEHCQDIVDRFFAQDQSYHEISAATGIASGTIASRISRCLTKLREALAEQP